VQALSGLQTVADCNINHWGVFVLHPAALQATNDPAATAAAFRYPVFPPHQAALAPVLLRRMKEDVEDLPEKEEVVVWCELTQEQRRCVCVCGGGWGGGGGGGGETLPGV